MLRIQGQSKLETHFSPNMTSVLMGMSKGEVQIVTDTKRIIYYAHCREDENSLSLKPGNRMIWDLEKIKNNYGKTS
jgi:hypothetical protein